MTPRPDAVSGVQRYEFGGHCHDADRCEMSMREADDGGFVLADAYDAACAERDWNREELRRTQQEFREARETHATLSARVERLEVALKKIANTFDESWLPGCLERRIGDEARAALSPQAEKVQP